MKPPSTNGTAPTREAAIKGAVERTKRRHAAQDLSILVLLSLPLMPFAVGREIALGWAICGAMVGLSMNVLAGYAGQISLAQAAIFGTGAFTMGLVTTNAGVPWLLAIPITALITAAVALVIGFPALKVRGLNLAVLTLGFQFVMEKAIFRKFEGGADLDRPTVFGVQLLGEKILFVAVIGLITLFLIDRNLTRSRTGRAFLALRQDEQVAASFGMSVARYKLLAFAISGFYAGVAGAIFALVVGEVAPNSFEFQYSIEFLVFAVLGGLGSRIGTAVGGAFPILYRQFLQFLANFGQLLGGVLLLYTLLRQPAGMAGEGRELRHTFQAFLRRGAVGVTTFVAITAASITLAFVIPDLVSSFTTDKIAFLLRDSVDTRQGLKFVLGLVIAAGGIRFGLQAAAKRLKLAPALQTRVTTDDEDVKVRTVKAPRIDLKRSLPAADADGPLLEIVNVTKRFGGVRALDDVSMTVERGELIGIMGPNGSGKTTLLNNISGFTQPTLGDIKYRGCSIIHLRPDERAGMGIGRTFQNIGLVKSETVADNLIIAQHLVADYHPMAGLLRTPGVVDEERRLRMRAAAVVEMLGLEDIVDEHVNALPHGLAKLVELGAALVTGPELLLLDEPAAGVSPREADALGETLQQVAKHFGVTIVMIEHHVPLMLSTCDYIYVLNFGKMLTSGLPMEVARHPDVIAAYLGGVGEEASLAVAGG